MTKLQALVIYTLEEWNQLQGEGGRWARTLAEETVWIYKLSLLGIGARRLRAP